MDVKVKVQITFDNRIPIPANIYLFKFNNRNTGKRYELCSKLTIKTPERRHRRGSIVFIVNFEHVSHLFSVFLLLILIKYMPAGIVHGI